VKFNGGRQATMLECRLTDEIASIRLCLDGALGKGKVKPNFELGRSRDFHTHKCVIQFVGTQEKGAFRLPHSA
jgi:hypothetical protein